MRTFLKPVAAFGFLLALGWTGAAAAAEAPPLAADLPKPVKERFKDAEITGTVVAYTKRSLSLEVGRNAKEVQEVLLPVDPAVTKFDRMTGMSDLERGDQIHVSYRQRYQQNDGGEWILKSAVATKISRLGHSLDSPRLKSDGSPGGGS